MNCPKCNKEVGATDKFCPYCGSSLNVTKVLSDTLPVNTMLKDKYRIERVLGENDSRIKYLAQDCTLQVYVVVYEFYPKNYVERARGSSQVVMKNETDKSQVGRWRSALLESIRDKNRVGKLAGVSDIRDCFELNNTIYVVTEWLSGDDLQTFLDRQGYTKPSDSQYGLKKRVDIRTAKQIFEPIIASLSKLHEAGTAYGNISPDDMKFGTNGLMKLSGFAWSIHNKSDVKEAALDDVYAVCAALYKCITGISPADANYVKKPSELGIEIDKLDEAAVMMGLSADPSRRFANMTVFQKALYRPQPVPSNPKIGSSVQPTGGSPSNPYNTGSVPITPPQNKSTAKTLVIILVIIALVAVAGAAGYIVWSSLSSGEETSDETDESDEGVEGDETAESGDEDETSQEELRDDDIEAYEAILEQAESDESFANQKEALEQLLAFVSDNDAAEYASDDIADIFDTYKSGVLDHIALLEGQGVIPAMYTQMNMELTEALDVASRIEEQDIEIDSGDLQDKSDSLKTDYKQRLIDNFDTEAQNGINSNGVISRSVLWAAMEGADQTGLYDDNDYSDPLKLRYILALTFHVDSELDSLGKEDAVARLYEVMASADYNPLLLYYLGDLNGDDYAKDFYLYASNVLKDKGYDFANMTTNEKRNFMYYYYTDDEYAAVRDELRTYMQEKFSPVQ